MNIRLAMFAFASISAAALVSFRVDHRARTQSSDAVQSWVTQHSQWKGDPNAPLPWRWRAPAESGRMERMASADILDVLRAGAGQEVWAVNEAAWVGADAVPSSAVPLISVSTAAFLGVEVPEDARHIEVLSREFVSALEPWRSLLHMRCGACVDAPMPFPAPAAPMITAQHGLDPRGATGINIDVERRRRSAVPLRDPASPMTSMVVQLRDGKLPTARHWATPGLAGMAALELASQQRTELTQTFLSLGQTGPSGTDRIAGLWAARLMGASDPVLDTIEAAL